VTVRFKVKSDDVDLHAVETFRRAAKGTYRVCAANLLDARRGDWVRCVRFWDAITRGVSSQHATAYRRTPCIPKPGHLTQSPRLEGV
jgi:hypothetical protein